MVRKCSVLRDSGGDYGLPKAKSAVASRNFVVGEHFKSGLGQARLESLREVDVMKCAPAETHSIEVIFISQLLGDSDEGVYETFVESSANLADGNIPLQIADYRLKQRARANDPAVGIR